MAAYHLPEAPAAVASAVAPSEFSTSMFYHHHHQQQQPQQQHQQQQQLHQQASAHVGTFAGSWGYQSRPDVYYQDYSPVMVHTGASTGSVSSGDGQMVKSENGDHKDGDCLLGGSGPQQDKQKKKKRRRECSPVTTTRLKKLRRRKANDRERNRMHGLNDALEDLRWVWLVGLGVGVF